MLSDVNVRLEKILFIVFQIPGSCREIDRERYKDFTFDHSYWSFDTNDDHYASQEEVLIYWKHIFQK